MLALCARLVAACSCLLVLNGYAFAQSEPFREGPAISLSEALARTLERSPELIAFGYQIEAAEGQLQQARLTPNPELNVAVQDVLGTDDYRGVDSAETTVTLGWVLERGVRQRLIDTAAANISLRNVDAEIVRVDAAAETARRFLVCLASQERSANAREAVRLAEETVGAVQVRVAAGRAPEAELARAEAALTQTELAEDRIEHELLSAYRRLSAQWGATQADFGTVSGESRTLPSPEPFETLIPRVEANPDLARFLSQQRVNEAELRLAEARSRPSWRVSGGLRRFEATDDYALVADLNVPLAWRDRNEGRIAEARANIARTAAEAAAARVQLEAALYTLYQDLEHDLHVAERLSQDVIPAIERALAETRRAYELGRYSYLEWNVVQAELLAARSELLEASVDAHRVVIEIERLTGVRVAAPLQAQ